MFAENLIFDIGMHKGEDADFYLKKGFRVIGVEANPALSDHCAKRFQDASQSGQMTIINKAITEHSGTIILRERAELCVGNGRQGLDATQSKIGSRKPCDPGPFGSDGYSPE